MNNPSLEHWERVSDCHEGALEFVFWLEREHGIRLDWDFAPKGTPLDIRRLADQCFQIDRESMERERREMIKALRTASSEASQ